MRIRETKLAESWKLNRVADPQILKKNKGKIIKWIYYNIVQINSFNHLYIKTSHFVDKFTSSCKCYTWILILIKYFNSEIKQL